VNVATPVSGWGEFAESFGGLWQPGPMSYAVRQFFENGGRDGVVVRVVAGMGAVAAGPEVPDAGPVSDAEILGEAASRTGLFALDADGFALLSIPPPEWNREVSLSTWAAAAAFCYERRAMLLVDAPAAWSADPAAAVATAGAGMRELAQAIGDRAAANAAVYFPRLRSADPLAGNALCELAPCGAVAGVFARTDAARGVWKAPAGTGARLTGAVGPALDLSDVELARLNTASLNCLRSVPRAGTVVWGARTMSGVADTASEWKFVPVRRLALYLERSIDRGTDWVVFEPNGETLWAQVRGTVESFLFHLFRTGAFAGSKTEEAFFVKCDRTTMTQDDVDDGRLILEIGFAPMKPAEFVVFRIGKKTAEAA
jgi:phage tail sheath protein FI